MGDDTQPWAAPQCPRDGGPSPLELHQEKSQKLSVINDMRTMITGGRGISLLVISGNGKDSHTIHVTHSLETPGLFGGI